MSRSGRHSLTAHDAPSTVETVSTVLTVFTVRTVLTVPSVLTLLAGCITGDGAVVRETPSDAPATSRRTWSTFGGDAARTHYSALDQIDRDNVRNLEVAWSFDTGDEGPTIQCNPIVVGGVMYVTSPRLKAIALDAATGKEIWRFDPFENYDGPEYWRYVSRGQTYWPDVVADAVHRARSGASSDEGADAEGIGGAPAALRLDKVDAAPRVFSSAGPYLYALDARTGRPITDFGVGGRIDLREGLGRDPSRVEVQATSPPIVYRDLLIVGGNVSESPDAAPGHIRAYSALTGALVWTFRTIPQEGDFGYDTWEPGAAERAGGVNPWSGFSLDAQRGLVYAATGAPTYDFYGGNRKGVNLFANTVLALDAATGRRIWHYQIVQHDIWDYDLPAPPTLVTIERDGRSIDAVAQITKSGFVFVLDRETGEPLFPVEERPVPASDVPGEAAWPTQRIPAAPPPFARQGISEADLTERTPEAAAYARRLFATLRSEGLYTPGSGQGTLMLPGFLGGGNWSGAAFDPSSGMFYVNANNFPSILRLVEIPDSIRAARERPEVEPAYRASGYAHFVDEAGYPAIKPPWGTLTALDLNAGTKVWQVPLGAYPELDSTGVPPTGTMNLGGAIVTAGGLVFIASTLDRKFRAFNSQRGTILWEGDLPTGGMALPATYQVNGKQYVVIAAGGGVGMRGARPIETPPGRHYVAFTLP